MHIRLRMIGLALSLFMILACGSGDPDIGDNRHADGDTNTDGDTNLDDSEDLGIGENPYTSNCLADNSARLRAYLNSEDPDDLVEDPTDGDEEGYSEPMCDETLSSSLAFGTIIITGTYVKSWVPVFLFGWEPRTNPG